MLSLNLRLRLLADKSIAECKILQIKALKLLFSPENNYIVYSMFV